jgi:hypothetical protein
VDELNSTVGIVALAAGGVALIALALCAAMAIRLRRIRREQRAVLGDGRTDLVEHAASLADRVAGMDRTLESQVAALNQRLAAAEERLDGAVSKTAVVRFDAFVEGSGRQSSSVALLDDRDTGVVFSAILQREQARVYAKPVFEGSSPLDLSPEELEAMERARRGDSAEPAG